MIDWAKYTAEQLKAELKKRRLRRTGRKNVLVARLTEYCDNERFDLFPKLPAELREAIFEMALPGFRVILVEPNWEGEDVQTKTTNSFEVYNIMRTNKEAYKVAVRRFPWITNIRNASVSWTAGRGNLMNIDLNTDAFCNLVGLKVPTGWDLSRPWYNNSLYGFGRISVRQIKMLTINMSYFLRWSRMLATALIYYTSLEYLIVIENLGSNNSPRGSFWLERYTTKSENSQANEIANNFYKMLEEEKDVPISIDDQWAYLVAHGDNGPPNSSPPEFAWKKMPAELEALKNLRIVFSKVR